ncbi:LOW QUALITY PROTEIN: spermatogenesis-associated protein 31E1-like [Lemur catta]|uniref:LOW QUALITY PROTEIN: spermatogenesis-associated protein 31E1-like n=1 Tax=Lemur catta TaxID=9447 RepID=UPI001E2686B0|nr:LOW QUALITY PROTEIN: spermatogenesis-associated protein 31E1-like [Lemur catta]
MENHLFSLKSFSASWLSPSSTSWVVDITLGFLCGLGLFLLLLPCLRSDPSSPPPGQKRNIRKVRNSHIQWRRGGGQGAGRRAVLRELSCPDPLGEVCKPAPASTHQPHGEHVEDAAPTTSTLLVSPAPLAEHPPSLASTLSVEPQGDQSDLKTVPPDTVPQGLPPGLASPIWVTSGLECTILFLSWWWATAKVLFFSTSCDSNSQQEPLFHHPPEACFWGDPTHRQREAGSPTFLHPNIWKLLEMLITKRAELKLWKGKEKEGQSSSAAPPSQGHGGHFQQKCSQLFWGLPSLHSESLVAAAWVSRTSPSKSRRSVSFNEVPDFFPVKTWPEAPSESPSAQLWPQHVAQPQPLMQTLPKPQHQPPPMDEIHTQAPLPPFPPDIPYCSPPPGKGDLTGDCRTTCLTSQEKARFLIPTKSEHLEWPLQKQLRWKRILPSLLKNAQEAFNQPTADFPQDSWASESHKSASTLPGPFTGPEHQEQQKQYTQRSFIPDKHESGPPCRSQASGELMQPQGEFLGMGQSRPPVFAAGASSKEVQKVGSRSSERLSQKGSMNVKEDEDPSRDLGQDLERGPEDPCTSSRNASVKVLEDNEKSEDWIRPQRYKSGNYLLRGPAKQHVEKNLKSHLDWKLAEIKGRVPVPRRTASHATVRSDTLTKPENVASWRGWKCCVNTSQELFFLDPCTQQMLEAHITRFQVRHRWGSNLQSLEPLNLKAQPPPFAYSSLPPWEVGEFGDNSIARFANFLGERPWKGPGEKVIKKKKVSLTLTGFLSAPSPVGEEVQRDLTETQSGNNHGHSEAPLTGQEGRWPSEPLTCNFMSRMWQSTTVLGTGRGSPEPGPSPAMARHEPWEEKESVASGDPCSSTAMLELTVGSQSSGAKETMEPVKAEEEKTPAWEVTLGASVMADSQTANVNLSSGSLGTSNISPLSRTSGTQDPGERHLKAQVVSKFEFKVQVEAENQLQGPATGVLLQDCAIGLCFRGRHTNMLPAEDMWPSQAPLSNSQVPLSGSQDVPSRDVSASQGFCDPTWEGGSSQGQQEPRSPKVKALWKSQSNMLGPTDKRPKRGQQEQTAAGPRASQASGMRHLTQVRETGETHESKYSQFLGKKGQAPPESRSGKRISHGLQCLDPSKKGTWQEAPLQKGKPASAEAPSPWPAPRRLSSGDPEVQAVITLVGQILVDKLGLRQGHGPSEFNYHKEDLQAPVDGQSCYPRDPYHPEQKKAMTHRASSHHATPMGHSRPVRNKWVRDRDSNWASRPREPMAPASPCQHGPRVARASGHLHY